MYYNGRMAKPRTIFVCQQCGAQQARWMGKCPDCNTWDSLVEQTEVKLSSRGSIRESGSAGARPVRLRDVPTSGFQRLPVYTEELTRVLGGGLVPGSVVLIGGDPGVGKCVTGDTRVLDPESGALFPITAWAAKQRSVLALDTQTHRLFPAVVTACLDQGVQPIVRLTTRLGRQLRCTPTHPVLTPEGWKPVGTLTPGDRIAVVQTLAYGSVYWDAVVAVEPAGEERVYDLTVPGPANFVANDLIVHNSTLLGQVAAHFAANVGAALYVSAEESAQQIKLRAERLGMTADDLYVYSETSLDTILQQIRDLRPGMVIIDSIQTVYLEDLTSAAGSVAQVREGALRLMQLAKELGIPIFLVGHVTKEGAIAGPRVLEHIVDVVLYLEGDRFHQYRLLRGVKNRFGSTNEVGVFEMAGDGLREVPNPSQVFLAERSMGSPGSTVAVMLEGTRPLLVEVQALTSTTGNAQPRRTTNGFDLNRLLMLTAVLTKRVGLPLFNQDVYVNIVGGLRIGEPAADLAVALAIASSYRNQRIESDLVLIGEVGLSGELRSVSQLDRRLTEAAKLGFTRAVVPATAQVGALNGLSHILARSLAEVVDLLARKP